MLNPICRVVGSVVLLAAPPVSGRDIAPQDPEPSQPVDHFVCLENAKDFPDWSFFVGPRDLARGPTGNSSVPIGGKVRAKVSAFNPLALEEAGGLRLFAIRRSLLPDGKAPENEWFLGGAMPEGVVASELLVEPQRFVTDGDADDSDAAAQPVSTVRLTTYRVKTLPPLTLELVSDKTTDSNDAARSKKQATRRNALVLSSGTAILIALIVAQRRQRRRNAA